VRHRNVFLFDSDGAHQYGALALMNCANLPRSMRSAAMRPKNAFPHALGQSRPSIYLPHRLFNVRHEHRCHGIAWLQRSYTE
jgi:hypothetical protein